jgi:hypothetical protein
MTAGEPPSLLAVPAHRATLRKLDRVLSQVAALAAGRLSGLKAIAFLTWTGRAVFAI